MRERCGDRSPSFAIRGCRGAGIPPTPSASGKDAHGASAGAFPALCPSCQEITPLQEISSARDLPPSPPLPPPSSLPTHTQPRRAHRHATSQPGAQLRFKQQQSHQNGFVWRKVYKKPGLPDARYWSVPSVSFVYRPRKQKSYRPFALLTPSNPINNASQTAKHLLIAPKEKSFRKVNWELSGFPARAMSRADRLCVEFHCG